MKKWDIETGDNNPAAKSGSIKKKSNALNESGDDSLAPLDSGANLEESDANFDTDKRNVNISKQFPVS